MVEWLAGNRIRGTSTERTGASVAQATPTKIIDGSYTVLTYTANGKFIPKSTFNVEYIVIAGGAGGGASFNGHVGGGGGGSGGFRTNVSGATSGGGSSTESAYGITAQNYTITVGSSGTGGIGSSTNGDVNSKGVNGGNSSITPVSGTTITSIGGGGGGQGGNGSARTGNAGGAGGGAGYGQSVDVTAGGAGTSGQGFAGGSSANNTAGSGGGGSGSVGAGVPSGSYNGGNGGSGTASSITGSSVTYAAGGGGGFWNSGGGTFGNGGSSIGGDGGAASTAGDDAIGYGSGGGGGSDSGNHAGGNGSNGIVILRFLTSGNNYDVEEIGLQLSLPSSSVGGWHEVGRTTLGSANTNILVDSLPDKKYYMILTNKIGDGSVNSGCWARLNSDTGSNYATRMSNNGGGDSTGVSQANGGAATSSTPRPAFGVRYISNLASKEKLVISNFIEQNTAGAGTAPQRRENVYKWTNTSNAVSAVTEYNTGEGEYDVNSEVVVLAWDPTDTHTTNFWEELASVDWTSGDTISSGTITAKKYLWVQINWQNTVSHYANLYFNADSNGANYASRQSINGTAEQTSASHNSGDPLFRVVGEGSGSIFLNSYVNMFIINNSANEKLIIANGIQITTAGANAPYLRNEAVGKWANTSEQITNITLKKTASHGNFSGGTMKVWGSD